MATKKRSTSASAAKKRHGHVCYFCAINLPYPSTLERHMITHTKEAPYFCDVCSKGFTTLSYIRNHKRMHMSQEEREQLGNSYPCKLCGKMFATAYKLDVHISTHTTEKPHNCDICNKRFAERSSMILHKNAVHQKLKPFPCATCGKAFGRKSHLKEHSVVHSEVRNFPCTKCLKKFKTKREAKKHFQAVHLEDEEKAKMKSSWKHVCYFCHNKLRSSCNLEIHMASHTKEKPHFCDICSKSFSRVSSLKRHKIMHMSKEQREVLISAYKYSCKICEKKFKGSHELIAHISSHTGERAFKCKVCNKAFSTHRSLYSHKKYVH